MPWFRPLIHFTWLMATLAVACVVGLVVDDRTLLGAPVWLKPLKFALSLALFGSTWAWLISLRSTRLTRAAGWVIAATGLIEIVIITGQAARGRMSHFNGETPLDATLFSVMGVAILVLWIATLIASIAVAATRALPRVDRLAAMLGMGITLFGMAAGGLMPRRASGIDHATGAHTVGAVDGGPGLPLTGWSTVAGDLRVPHFIGMHALQLLPLLAIALAAAGLAEVVRVRLVWTVGAVYAGVVGVSLWQALAGQPLLGPGTAVGMGYLLVGVIGVAGVAWSVRARAASTPPPGAALPRTLAG